MKIKNFLKIYATYLLITLVFYVGSENFLEIQKQRVFNAEKGVKGLKGLRIGNLWVLTFKNFKKGWGLI